MRVLVIDIEAQNLDFVLRCVAAGDEVRWYRWSKTPIRDGEGMKGFQIVNDWRPSMSWARDGLVLITGNFVHLHELDRYRQDFGYTNIFGPTVQSAKLEIDRGAGMKAMEAIGINIPPYTMLGSLEEAERFARKSDRCYVFKPGGDADKKELTYVSSSPADMVGWLQRQIKSGTSVKQCMMQEKIELMSELGVSGWMSPEGFLPGKWQACVEHKKHHSGELGQNTGETGTVMQYCEQDKLAKEMLEPFEPLLRTLGHTGDFSIGAMVDTKGKAWPLEFTARLGYPAWHIQTASHRGNPSKWMKSLMNGHDDLRVSEDVAIGVVCFHGMFPHNKSKPEDVEEKPMAGVEEVWNDLHPVSMMLGKGPMMKNGKVVDGPVYMSTGEYVMVATGLGKTITRAQKKVYGTIKNVKLANMAYRNDIGDKVKKALPDLQKAGYLRDMEA